MDREPDQKGKALVCIVGPNNLQNQLLVSFFEEEQDPGMEYICRREISEALWDVSERDVLLLLDCQDMDPFGESGALNVVPVHSLMGCSVCLFNVPPQNGKETDFLRYGIRGIFFSNSPYEIIRKAIPAILDGELWYPRKTLARCALENSGHTSSCNREIGLLTSREREILLKIASGASNQDISDELFISLHTVKTHIYNIFRKIGVKNRIEASLWARENLGMLRNLSASGN